MSGGSVYTSPEGSLGVSGDIVGGPCTCRGTDSAPFGMFPTPENPGVPMYVGGDQGCQAVTVYTSPGRPCGKVVCGPLPFQVRVLSNRFSISVGGA